MAVETARPATSAGSRNVSRKKPAFRMRLEVEEAHDLLGRQARHGSAKPGALNEPVLPFAQRLEHRGRARRPPS